MIHMQLKGRLGNTCFQAATAIAYSLDNDVPFTLSSYTKDPVMQPLYFQHLVKPLPDLPGVWYREMQHNYVPIPFEEEWRGKNIFLDGFFQSARYFDHRRDEVLKLLNIPYNPVNCVSIHIRRGDYLTIPGKHIVFNDEYFEAAFDIFHRQMGYDEFKVFTDDPEWASDYFANKGLSFEIVKGNDPLTDLSLMSSCKHHIGSASTMSWWGNYLTQDEESIAVMPKQWFQATQHENTSDILMSKWVTI